MDSFQVLLSCRFVSSLSELKCFIVEYPDNSVSSSNMFEQTISLNTQRHLVPDSHTQVMPVSRQQCLTLDLESHLRGPGAFTSALCINNSTTHALATRKELPDDDFIQTALLPMRQQQIPIPGRAPQNQFPLHKINTRAGTLFKLQITCCNSITLLQGQDKTHLPKPKGKACMPTMISRMTSLWRRNRFKWNEVPTASLLLTRSQRGKDSCGVMAGVSPSR
jgi:hypothetical protein